VADIFGSLDVLLDHLVVGGDQSDPGNLRASMYRDFALTRASLVTRADDDGSARQRFELRLRLALHLAPAAAINYDSGNPTARWRLVHDYLVSVFARDPDQTKVLARDIALVLDNWDRKRADVTRHRDFLIRRDGPYCAACQVRFLASPPVTLSARDDFKPYYTSPEELLSIEVDHIEAISGLGTNVLSNLQLLCRLCNSGKGDGLGVEIRMEARYAGAQISEVPVAHRARMFYYVIDRDGHYCALCGSSGEELTVRPLVPTGGYIRSNLQAVCVDCAGLRADMPSFRRVT
jgi:5-methylcytosine-specific restriction endonuclease McrA